MSKMEACDYCSNSRTYEMTEEDEWDLNFCYDDEHDLSARSIFISEDKQFDIMIVSGAGKPPRLEFRHWNKEAQRWFVYDIKYLKHCINCGREITEYPEFVDEKDKKIVDLEKQIKILKEEYSKLIEDKFDVTKEKFEWKGYAHTLEYKLKELPKKIVEEIRMEMGSIEDILINCGNGKEDALCWFNNILKEILKKYGVEDE